MKQTTLGMVVICQLFLAANAGPLFAQADSSIEAVKSLGDKALLRRDGAWLPLTREMTLREGIEVFTNGTFQVKQGKTRLLKKGQILRVDGNLLNADGSIIPVIDHIAMSGKVTVYRDGEAEALVGPLTLPDGSLINPDGSYTRPRGQRSRLVDGQLLTLDGVTLAGLDTVTFCNGKVIVYKAGTLITLRSPEEIMGMSDGNHVKGNGVITAQDGKITQLSEGQTITVEGLRASW